MITSEDVTARRARVQVLQCEQRQSDLHVERSERRSVRPAGVPAEQVPGGRVHADHQVEVRTVSRRAPTSRRRLLRCRLPQTATTGATRVILCAQGEARILRLGEALAPVMASVQGAQAYIEVWGEPPAEVQGAEPPVRCPGATPLKLKAL